MPKVKDVDWDIIRKEYESGGYGYGSLAKKYGVNKSTVSERSRREGWKGTHAHTSGSPKKALKIVKNEIMLHQDSDNDHTKAEINLVIEKWNTARKTHQGTVQNRLATLDELADKMGSIISDTPASIVLVKDFKLMSQVMKDISQASTSLIATHRQVFGEEIETIRAQQANTEDATETQIEAVAELFLINE